MKKISITLLTLLILVGTTTSIFADPTNSPFTPSVETKEDVKIPDGIDYKHSSYIQYKSDEDECMVDVVVTPFSHRDEIANPFNDELNLQSQAELQEAYESIKSKEEVVEFAPVLKGRGKEFSILDECMVVSTLFDVSTYHEGEHDPHADHRKVYNLKVGADSLKYFMFLLHYDAETDKWEVVPGAQVTGKNKDTLTFSYHCCSPFAIITCGAEGNCQNEYCALGPDGKPYDNPTTGVNDPNAGKCNCLLHFGGHCYCYIPIILLVISLIANVYFILKNKQDENRADEIEERLNRLERSRDIDINKK